MAREALLAFGLMRTLVQLVRWEGQYGIWKAYILGDIIQQ